MTEPILRENSRQWRTQLADFVEKIRTPLPDLDDLDPLQDWQRGITGGLLKQFFEFLEQSADKERYPQLEEHPLAERLFVFISDEAGLLAAEGLMDTDSPQAICVLKEEFRAFLETPGTDKDEAFVHHYEFWSVWHQNVPDTWDVPELEPGFSYWIHEEGFALADKAGRGAQHLWRWDGKEFKLAEEMMTSWVS